MQSRKGYMININTCPRVILTCIPGIGEAIATRIMAIREKGTHIDQDVLSQIPYMKVTEGTLGLIDFSPRPQAEVSELNGGRPGSSLCEPPQESLNSDRNACRSEYRTPSPRTNMVVRPQPDSQHDRDAQKQPDDRVFSPLTLDWNIPHPVVEDCHRQQEHGSYPTNQQQGVNRVQQPLSHIQRNVQIQHQVQGLQQRLDQLQLGVNNSVQPEKQQHRAAPPVSLPQQQLNNNISDNHYRRLTNNYLFLAFNNNSLYDQESLKPYYNQPSARPKEYNSDYYGRQRRSDPGYKYTGDSDTSDVSAFRHTRNKRRSEPEYNREDFSTIRSIRSSPLHRTRTSPRRFTESPSESDTDGRRSRHSRVVGRRKKIK
ncbi:Hypothetical predicted protein [Mytilus galloprovincialis]|uniref:Uncharacterized protein n=1 Tax=Mytilus galloprovincialis TaxID=29158 RepID=A0A8B6DYS9_MYTGA|nr:Hypothetical predicted protein [Mytilus galloprovincialis]